MLAELLSRSGARLLEGTAPEGRDYWAARFWDRDEAEANSMLGPHYRDQKRVIADLMDRHAADASNALEFACGTGVFTAMTAEHTKASEITAMDISHQGLEIARQRVPGDRVRLIQGDFWQDLNLPTADLVMCFDAIHHIGDVPTVLERMKTFMAPGATFIGNLWTADHFSDLQRYRFGPLGALRHSVLFFGTAVMIKATNGSMRTASYRTQLMRTDDIAPMLRQQFGTVLDVFPQRYFTAFAARV